MVKRWVSFDIECKTKPVNTPNFPLEVTDTCVKHIWRAKPDAALKWARGCKPFGAKRNPRFRCAVYADSRGRAKIMGDCLTDTNPEGCNMNKPRLKQDKVTDFIYPLLN